MWHRAQEKFLCTIAKDEDMGEADGLTKEILGDECLLPAHDYIVS